MLASEREALIRARLADAPHRVPLSTAFAGSRGRLGQRLRAFAAACFVIERAHAAGIVHRDLRPTTILIGELWDAEVIGWGSAFVPNDSSPLRPVTTPYAAPELASGIIDARADVYSLGKILAELVEGQSVSPELELLCAVATSFEPAKRVLTARQLGEAVLGFVEGERDWQLRKSLAASHLANARAAVDDAAVAEASIALRLDPTLRPAADVLIRAGRMPDEILQLVAIEENYGLRDSARIAIWAYVGYLLFAPAFLWFASGEHGYALALLVLVALNIGLLAIHGYTERRLSEIWFVLANAALIALIARVSSPFLLAPGIAALTATALGMSPTYLRPPIVVTMIACLTLAIILPWLAEIAGVLSPTMHVVKETLVFAAPALHLREGAQIVLLVFYVVTLIASAGWLAYSLMYRERRLRYRTYLQLWQMRENLLDR